MNMAPQDLQNLQNEVPRGAWNHQICEKVENVNFNENTCFYNVFERLGHQKSADFPITNHQESWLQSKHAFWCFKSDKIWKSDPTMIPKWHPKFMKNRYKFTRGHSRALLSEPWHQIIIKLMPKWYPRTPKCSQNALPRLLRSINLNAACQQLPGDRRQGRSL